MKCVSCEREFFDEEKVFEVISGTIFGGDLHSGEGLGVYCYNCIEFNLKETFILQRYCEID